MINKHHAGQAAPSPPRSAEELFEDVLEIGYIPAVRRGVPPGRFIPAEYVTTAPTPVTILHDEPQENTPIAVLVEKDEAGIIRTIKVHCACGCSAVITLHYGTEEQQCQQQSVPNAGGN